MYILMHTSETTVGGGFEDTRGSDTLLLLAEMKDHADERQ